MFSALNTFLVLLERAGLVLVHGNLESLSSNTDKQAPLKYHFKMLSLNKYRI